MAELIQKQDTLNEGRVKINAAITDAEQAKVTADGADSKATQALANSESTQTQLDTIVINGDSSVEAAQARVDEKGVGHTTLKDRIDDGFTKVTSQLNEKAEDDFFVTNKFKGTINPQTESPVYFYDMLSDINHPYFNINVVGKDQSGQYDIKMYTYEPVGYEKELLIIGSIHGDEVYPAYFLHNLIKLLTGITPPQLSYIKEKVKLIIFPILNPWGMYQSPKSRFNSRGVDLNRNWDWRWNEADGAKGDAPFSEVENRYVKYVLDSNKNISAFMDLHDFVNGAESFDYAFYAEPKTESVMKELVEYMIYEVENPHGRLVSTTNDPTSNNYTSQVLNIPSVNVEGLPGAFGDKGSDIDNNKNFDQYANALILMSKRFSKNKVGEYSSRTFIKDFLDDIILLTDDYQDIQGSELTFTPLEDGYISSSGFAMAKQDDVNGVFAARLLISQDGFITPNTGVASPYLPAYTTGKYPVLPISSSIPVVKNKQVTIKLEAMREGTGKCHFKRFNFNVIYTSASNARHFGLIQDGYTFL